jgi:hypothetical protein
MVTGRLGGSYGFLRFDTTMVNDHDIRSQLAEYLAGEISLASFERWLNRSVLPIVVDDDDPAFKLAASLMLLVSERHDHVISDGEFRKQLFLHVNNIVVSHPVGLPRSQPFGQFFASAASQFLQVGQRVVA